MSNPENNILDQEAFSYFKELIGENFKDILLRHLEIANGYINNIEIAIKISDLKAAADAAHPLGSSSRQIGAFQVAEIAENIEETCTSSATNLNTLHNLVLKLKNEQSMVDDYIKSSIVKL